MGRTSQSLKLSPNGQKQRIEASHLGGSSPDAGGGSGAMRRSPHATSRQAIPAMPSAETVVIRFSNAAIGAIASAAPSSTMPARPNTRNSVVSIGRSAPRGRRGNRAARGQHSRRLTKSIRNSGCRYA